MTFTIPNQADAIEDPTDKWPQSEPDSRDFADILAAGLNLTGVVSGCTVDQQLVPDMSVAVASGVVIVGGTSATVAAGNVTIGVAGAQPRFDLVCVSSAGVKSAVAGTAATNPVFPNPSGKVVLAAVYVPASDTAIGIDQIVDKRVLIKPWTQLSGDTMTGNLVLRAVTGITVSAEGDTAGVNLRGSTWGDTSAISPLAQLLLRRFRGTVAAPLRTKSGDLMGRIGGSGAHAADDVSAATLLTAAKSYLEFRTAEAFTSTAQGSDIRFFTTPTASTTAVERMRMLDYGELMMDDIQGYAARKYAKYAAQYASTNQAFQSLGWSGGYFRTELYGAQGASGNGVYANASDKSTVKAVNVSGAANNGSGLIRITTSAVHGLTTGDRVGIGDVGGVPNANGYWVVTVINTTTVDLQASTFAGTYTSGGKLSSAGILTGVFSFVSPVVERNLSGVAGAAGDGNDVACFIGWNGGTAAGVDAFYLGRNSATFPSSDEWFTGMTIAARCNIGIQFGTVSTLGTGIAFNGTITGSAIKFGAGHNIELATTTGTKIGTGTTQLLAFHNSTPVAQQTVTGSRASGAALADLLTKLAAKGLIVDGSSA